MASNDVPNSDLDRGGRKGNDRYRSSGSVRHKRRHDDRVL